MRFGPIISAVLVSLALAATAQAAPPAEAGALARQLNAHTTALAGERYALAAGPLTDESGRFVVRLWAGQNYVFAAACETACGGLALRVIDPNGDVVAQNDAPVLHVRPRVTGRHTIEAAAPTCGARACWFALNVYAR